MILRSRILLPYSSTFSHLGRGYTADVFPAVVYHLGLLSFSNYITSQGLLCCFCFTSVCEVVAEGECIETAFALFWHGCWRLVSGLFLLGMGAGDRWGINFSSGVGWKLAGSVFFFFLGCGCSWHHRSGVHLLLGSGYIFQSRVDGK